MDPYTTSEPVLETLDPEIGARLAQRDAEIARGASVARVTAAGLAMASVPVALAALARDVFAQGGLPANIVTILNFALMHEYMESTLYNYGLSPHFAIVPEEDFQIFQTIQTHENLHVQYLLATLGSQAVREPFFDFSGGSGSYAGPYHAAFYVYDEFKALSQSFEDLGVRMYKGQLPALMGMQPLLLAALQIHSVEARHASEVRRLRGSFLDNVPNRGWIAGDETDITLTSAFYAGEQNTVQDGIDIVTLNFSADDASEAFDEPLTMQQVQTVLTPFLIP
jgi:Ferritin-like domain